VPPDPAPVDPGTTQHLQHPLSLVLRPAWAVSVAEPDEAAGGSGAQVVCRSGAGPPVWLEHGGWRVLARPDDEPELQGEVVATFTGEGGRTVRAIRDAAGNVVVPFSLSEAYRSYVAETWRLAAPPARRLSERQLALFYRVKALIPRGVQLFARRSLIRYQGVPAFPAWPLDTSVSSLVRFFAACALRAAGREQGEFAWFWPGQHRAALALTHDVESAEGIRLALALADLEEEHGFRSAFNFGGWYSVDPGVLRELSSRGFEIGMHGLVHDRTLFSSREAFEASLPALGSLAGRLGAVGFRSPATHRVFDWLGELPVEYDCTIPNSDPYEPQPGGCCSVWPFFVGPVVELPYTLPQDHTQLTLLQHRSPSVWLEQAGRIEAEYGLVQCVTHPDRGYLAEPDKRAVYAGFLEGLTERGGLWRALPREIAAWWRRRADADGPTGGSLNGTVSLRARPAFADFEPPAA
jgi:peptidoglycan/xylan/chitin deacetylase (PgdA/CDA1 family)